MSDKGKRASHIVPEEKAMLSEGSISLLKEKLPLIIEQRDVQTIRDMARDLLTILPEAGSNQADARKPVKPISLEIVTGEINQIAGSRTPERAIYYANRLYNSLNSTRSGRMNDIDLSRWKEYDEIITDSLWIEEHRDRVSGHSAWYWGNFIPLIPRQMMMRYTRKGDWVLDPFQGSGTTLIECRRMGRNGIGIDLNAETVNRSARIIEETENTGNVSTRSYIGNALSIDYSQIMTENGIGSFKLVIMHPPYQDIIKFSDSPEDLSNIADTDDFVKRIGDLAGKMRVILQRGGHLVLVIGDKYSHGALTPLGFYCMNEIMQRGFTLKSMVVKNFDVTRGKRNSEQLWRYRALSGGFYVFKHEYMFIFTRG